MKKLLFIFFLVACLKLIHAMSETCTTSTSHLYSNRMSFRSTKSDGSSYYCTCRGRDCSYITCNKETFAIPVQPGEGEGGITGEVPEEEEEEEEEEDENAINIPEVTVVGPEDIGSSSSASGGRCYDEISERYFERGATFTRMPTSTEVRKTCTCPSRGRPEITCRIAGCPQPSPPKYTSVERRYATGCYDVWNQEEYPTGSTYERTRPMDEEGLVNGTYRCDCAYGMMRCTAVDIPCCDLDTGEFKDMNERFITVHASVKMRCTCMRQRGRYQNCLLPDGGNPFGYGGRLVTGTRYRPISGFPRPVSPTMTTCKDRNGRSHRFGQRYREYRRGQGWWACICRDNGRGSISYNCSRQ
ncbi:uncharacterized protein LOC143448247 [Clavelina lepadiformis]|uniref:uncharacterized protein LOC143448247 n=1 Tax=Clavelina lepadiformis TaxID=159417 RepID=UPI004040F1DA